ncbi:MAG: carbon-nitrogen hydrolase family protein [Anaerolineaceae bacterium]
MVENKVTVGLVIPRSVKDSDSPFSELEKFTAEKKPDVFLFPEDHIYSENIDVLRNIAKEKQKWIICGMEDRDVGREKFKHAIVVDPHGEIVGHHRKTSLTYNELSKGFSHGDALQVVNTDFGVIGVSICYEIHFPEVARTYALQGAKIIFNPIGTGMWNETQFAQWTAAGRSRAAENGIFAVGCSHYNDAVPLAYAYTPDGSCLVQTRDANRLITVTLDLSQCFGMFLEHRQPHLYGKLIE